MKNKIILFLFVLMSSSNFFGMEKPVNNITDFKPPYRLQFTNTPDWPITPLDFTEEPQKQSGIDALVTLVSQEGIKTLANQLIQKKDRTFPHDIYPVITYFILQPNQYPESVIPDTQKICFSQTKMPYRIKLEPYEVPLEKGSAHLLEQKLSQFRLFITPEQLQKLELRQPTPAETMIPTQPNNKLSSWRNFYHNHPYLTYVGGASIGLFALVFAAYKFDFLPNKASHFFTNLLPSNMKK